MSDPLNASSPLPAAPIVRESVATYSNYADAQAAVDLLSDKGFPVASTQIVGHDVSTVETVTGRLTLGRAAGMGAAGGAWFGLFIGLIFGLFTPGVAWVLIVLGTTAFGALWGAIAGYFTHLATGGRRDFSSVQTLQAARYEVLVESSRAAEASRILFTKQSTPA